ncbi:MAG: hypothetical protein ACI9MR_003050 [Myxococcota bacterium]|jgi:hypothetical protein
MAPPTRQMGTRQQGTRQQGTRQMGRRAKSRDRYLYRTNGHDYGPVTMQLLLRAVADRKVELTTLVSKVGGGRWEPAATHPEIREFYDICQERWASEELDAEADARIKRMSRRHTASTGIWRILLVGLLVAGALGTWLVWRLSQAEPIGLASLFQTPSVGVLTDPPKLAEAEGRLALSGGTHVARLAERETYDTSGVAVTNAVPMQASTKMSFNADGSIKATQAIPKAILTRVMGAAQRRLYKCAQSQARRDTGFRGTQIGFSVASGGIKQITVGPEMQRKPAFIACVKSALRGVSVARFDGNPRRVTIPVKVGR